MSRKWSVISSGHTPKNKSLAKAFELALDREFRSVIRRAKDMAGQIEQPTDLWDLEHYLTESRKRIDRTYDYRYSVLTDVFGRLVREGRLSEDELQGLGEDKLQSIRSYARLLAKLDEEARNLEAHE
jgi:hypothetical protein